MMRSSLLTNLIGKGPYAIPVLAVSYCYLRAVTSKHARYITQQVVDYAADDAWNLSADADLVRYKKKL